MRASRLGPVGEDRDQAAGPKPLASKVRSAYRRRLLVYGSRYAEASEPVAFSLMLSDAER